MSRSKLSKTNLVYSDVYQIILKDNKQLFSYNCFSVDLIPYNRDYPLKSLLKNGAYLHITGISKYLLKGGKINVVKMRQDPLFYI